MMRSLLCSATDGLPWGEKGPKPNAGRSVMQPGASAPAPPPRRVLESCNQEGEGGGGEPFGGSDSSWLPGWRGTYVAASSGQLNSPANGPPPPPLGFSFLIPTSGSMPSFFLHSNCLLYLRCGPRRGRRRD